MMLQRKNRIYLEIFFFFSACVQILTFKVMHVLFKHGARGRLK